MMKIWCETCSGYGRTYIGIDTCADCNGKGYTENKELKHLARIGEATEKAFGENSCVLFIDSIPNTEESFEHELTSVEKLLEWAESEGE